MTAPNGIHHLALSTGNMKGQIEFFTDVIGMELVALYWMHGVEGAWHAFLKLNDESSLAFCFVPGNENVEIEYGKSHAGSGAGVSAPGTMQHLAFNVPTMEALLNMRDRVRSRGVNILGPIRHGMCQSVYFAGPEGLTLEFATSDTSEHPLDNKQTWIDPEVCALAGISDEDLKRYTNPAFYKGEGGAVAQPPYDPTKPHSLTPAPEMYQAALLAPDQAITDALSIIEPPNLS